MADPSLNIDGEDEDGDSFKEGCKLGVHGHTVDDTKHKLPIIRKILYTIILRVYFRLHGFRV